MSGHRIVFATVLLAGGAGCNALSGLSSLEPVDCVEDCGGGGGAGGSSGGAGGNAGGSGGAGGGSQGGASALQIATVVAGRHGSCVIGFDGRVQCWGETIGSASTPTSTTPVELEGSFVDVGKGFSHACGYDAMGTVSCWGNNDHGQLGDGTHEARAVPVEVVGLPPVERFSIGANHTCVATDDLPPQLFCWGDNTYGQLGTGDRDDRASPFELTGLGNVIRIAAGVSHTCAVVDTGEVSCWGLNDEGQLGLDPNTDPEVLTPQLVVGLPPAERIYPGNKQTCLRGQGDRELHCWGGNEFGQLGDGTVTPRFTPALIPDVAEVADVITGLRHTCALDNEFTLFCWGANDHGQLGTPMSPTPQTTPAQVATEVRLFAGKHAEHSCSVGIDDVVRCSGLNDSGQLGNGTYESTDQPTPVTF